MRFSFSSFGVSRNRVDRAFSSRVAAGEIRPGSYGSSGREKRENCQLRQIF